MKSRNQWYPPLWLATTLALSACGGGGGGSDPTGSTPDESPPGAPTLGAAVDGDEEEPTVPTRSIDGRVADGYLQGAVVCVDLNENESCDEGEPSAVTGEGGVWALNAPADSADKPVIADIPATAIDEDTGEAIGQALVFSAPAEKPGFLSPITTLVQQELRSNPGLDIDAAESVVKTSLGIEDGEDVSLFDDYVAESTAADAGDEESSERANRFRYLHDTARVVASMMKDIEAQVVDAATEQGVDVQGGQGVGQAVRELVRSEIRQLLPAIAQAVAEAIDTDDASDEDGGNGAEREAFDPGRLALALRPENVTEGIDERLEAIRDREPPVEANLESVFAEGIYWIDVECEHHDRDDHDDRVDAEMDMEDMERQNDDADAGEEPELVFGPDDEESGVYQPCMAFYGQAQADEDGVIDSAEFTFDLASGQWLELDERDEPRDWVLVDGEWVAEAEGGPFGTISFAADGAAILTNDTGGMTTVYGATMSLSNTSVENHLADQGNEPPESAKGLSFAEGASTTRMKILEAEPPYVLFNYQDVTADDGDDCAQFNSNCNVVYVLEQDGGVPQSSIEDIQALALNRVDIQGMGFESDGEFVSIMRFGVAADHDGSVPDKGIVRWLSYAPPPGEHFGPDGEFVPPGEHEGPDGESGPPDEHFGPDGEFGPPDGPAANPDEGPDREPNGPSEPGEGDADENDLGFEFQSPDRFDPDSPPSPANPDNPLEPFEPPVTVGGPTIPDSLSPDEEAEEPFEPLEPGELPLPAIPDVAGEPIDEGDGSEPVTEPDVGGLIQPPPPPSGDDPDGNKTDTEDGGRVHATTRWMLNEIDGVTVIEIETPAAYRKDRGDHGAATIIFAVQDGYVRKGLKRAPERIDSVDTYNESAFETLRQVVESFLTQETETEAKRF